MKHVLWDTLYQLSLLRAHEKYLKTSTTELAETLNLTQQTVSRHLILLEEFGLIDRRVTVRGQEIKISNRGLDELKKVYYCLQSVLEASSKSVVFEGKLFSGVNEASYYMNLEPYRKQFSEKIGFDPYPGTLNLKLTSPPYIELKREVATYPGVLIESFSNKNRSYGLAKCYQAKINGRVDGAVIIVDRTHYDDSVLEVIAPVYLRGVLNLEDGDLVHIEVKLT
jgi:riboflavin kinase